MFGYSAPARPRREMARPGVEALKCYNVTIMMISARRRRALCALFAAVFLGSAHPGAAAADAATGVVASIKPVHSLVSAVMQGTGEPHLIMRGTESPHTFNLRPSDAAVLQDARVVFLIGEAIETSLLDAAGTLARDARIVTLFEAEGLTHRPLREGGAFEAHDHDHHGHHEDEGHGGHEEDGHSDGEEAHGHGADDHHDHHGHHEGEAHAEEEGSAAGLDMHIWLDPANAKVMAATIAAALSEADPANAGTYAANAEALHGRLDDLIEEVAAEVAPVRDKPFIVFHDAYRHFEDRFGLAAAGSVVVSADQSPSARRIMELRDKVSQLGATCVFAEVQFEPRVVDTIVEDTQAKAGTLDPIGAALDAGPGAYFQLIRNMAASFRSCLE